ncbi:MAG TPA: DRTGG domain-containing protein [Bacteroidales bacterium]|nr:DRTGG domain-containing protein [Bacteroidales bacterium]
MKLKEIIDKLSLRVLTSMEDKDVTGVYVSDMLSDVMSKAQAGNLWITVQTHKNVIAAANLIDISAVIISQGTEVPKDTIDLANRFNVVLLGCDESTFDVVGKLFQAGIK